MRQSKATLQFEHRQRRPIVLLLSVYKGVTSFVKMAASNIEKRSPLFDDYHDSYLKGTPICHHVRSPGIASKTDFRYRDHLLESQSTLDRLRHSWYFKAGLTMVAIPAYFLAHAVYSSLASLLHEGATIPIPRHNLTETHTSISAFATVQGPHVTQNFPDPAIIHVDGISYSFATNNRKTGPDLIHIQMATSTDNVTWIMSKDDALPHVGAWETGEGIWAPDVVQLKDGTFVLYYAGQIKSSPAHHCVGVATATSVMGPYTPQATPFACPDPATLGGAIDPDGFLDESTGRRYVTYKVDGNSNGHGGSCNNMVAPLKSTPIILQEVAENGITPIGDAIQILDRDKYDGPLIEAPAMYRSDEGIYFLFFSSNCFTGPLYDTSYATATNITGPYTKSARPLFITGDGPNLIGPGGMDIIKGGGMIVFHSHLPPISDGRKNRKKEFNLVRAMYSAMATFDGHTVTLA
jgi:hypothetical protein